jgi:hypothetical protein
MLAVMTDQSEICIVRIKFDRDRFIVNSDSLVRNRDRFLRAVRMDRRYIFWFYHFIIYVVESPVSK